MPHSHPQSYGFQLVRNGVLHDCSFVLTDDRLITVLAAGRKRSEMLHGVPPRALATTIALELIRERPVTASPAELIAHQERRTWLDRLFGRSIADGAPFVTSDARRGLDVNERPN